MYHTGAEKWWIALIAGVHGNEFHGNASHGYADGYDGRDDGWHDGKHGNDGSWNAWYGPWYASRSSISLSSTKVLEDLCNIFYLRLVSCLLLPFMDFCLPRVTSIIFLNSRKRPMALNILKQDFQAVFCTQKCQRGLHIFLYILGSFVLLAHLMKTFSDMLILKLSSCVYSGGGVGPLGMPPGDMMGMGFGMGNPQAMNFDLPGKLLHSWPQIWTLDTVTRHTFGRQSKMNCVYKI